ncbi:MAG: hypothetical protein GY696_25020 [Gammaproteobacteria bacterium]|nr:hypothetical protein [Gammaproteobacteria bacterium]
MTKKIWVCVAVCRYTSAVNLEMVEEVKVHSYRQIFTNRQGTPTSILSDRGTQIVATSKARVFQSGTADGVGWCREEGYMRVCTGWLTPCKWTSRKSY